MQGPCKKLGAYPKIAPFKAGQSYDPDALHGKAPEWVEFREGTTPTPTHRLLGLVPPSTTTTASKNQLQVSSQASPPSVPLSTSRKTLRLPPIACRPLLLSLDNSRWFAPISAFSSGTRGRL